MLLPITKDNTFEVAQSFRCGCFIIIVDHEPVVLKCKDHDFKLSEDRWV